MHPVSCRSVVDKGCWSWGVVEAGALRKESVARVGAAESCGGFDERRHSGYGVDEGRRAAPAALVAGEVRARPGSSALTTAVEFPLSV